MLLGRLNKHIDMCGIRPKALEIKMFQDKTKVPLTNNWLQERKTHRNAELGFTTECS